MKKLNPETYDRVTEVKDSVESETSDETMKKAEPLSEKITNKNTGPSGIREFADIEKEMKADSRETARQVL